MEFAFNEDQQELQKSARRFLQANSEPAALRRVIATEDGFDRAAWQRICEELLWPGLAFDESEGGYGFTFLELAPILEEMGRTLFASPFFASVCMAAQAIRTCADDTQRAALLPPIASGAQIATLAHVEPGKAWHTPGNETSLTNSGDTFTLSGTKRYVEWGHVADTLVVSGYDTDGTRRLAVVSADAAGVTVEKLATMDLTRPMAQVSFDGVEVAAENVLNADDGALQRALDIAGVALACEQVGAAEACLDMAVEYAKTRNQFGRAIGSFQAIKHKCANMMLYVESARSAAYFAAWAAANSPGELPEASAVAQAYCTDALFRCASDNIQIHGGIGITWECDAQLYFKRAQAASVMLGSASTHRERVASLIPTS